jgi:transpeptidase family protein/penicillin-binding protein/MecA-like transpeptidase family protein
VEDGARSGARGASRYSHADVERRRRLLRRAVPAALLLGAGGLAAGLLLGSGPGRAERRTAERFVIAWGRGDYAGMYRLLDDDSRRRVTVAAFTTAVRAAAATATVRGVVVGPAHDRRDGAVPVDVRIRTRAFGVLREQFDVPLSGSGEDARVAWSRRTVFPGLRPGEQLTRTTTLAPRADLLARDGTVLARGADRSSEAPDVSAEIVGQLGPAPAGQQETLRALGYPDGAQIGISGLERAFEPQLAGIPGGTLLAGGRILARTRPRPSRAVRTTLDVGVERAAITALAGRYGGIAAMIPSSGEILALAGVAFSALQPPGSTFKIVTLTGVLESHVAKPSSAFPIADHALVGGVPLQNANGEYCGGTLVQAFAESCNSVFAPLGAQLGARRLVDVAQRYGFNEPPRILGAAQSTIPLADAMGDDLAVGSSAIGQGMVQATTLQMTIVAATIALRGRRPQPTLLLGARPRLVRVTRPAVAREVGRMMRAVVEYGTGTAAAIPGGFVAGKTGTAELRTTVPPQDQTEEERKAEEEARKEQGPGTDAWFVAYAPAPHPRIAVGALFANAGAGGDVAAPAARGVLIAGLQATRRR